MIAIDILALSEKVEDYVIRTRRKLHERPELSMQETETIQFVCNELSKMDIPFEIVQDGGIIGTIRSKNGGKTLILRADLDALPMQESETNLKQRKKVISKVPGVAHTCGHDAHTAMLLGVAKILTEYNVHLNGTVLLVFEQGEEVGGGIRHLTKRLIELGADGIWGIHLKNDLPSGKISVEAGPRMAAPLPFDVTIKGKGGHGSRPDLAASPIDCFVDFHAQLTKLVQHKLHPHKPITFSIGSLHAGSAANVIPETVQFAGTARFLHKEQGKSFEKIFKHTLAYCTKLHGCDYDYTIEPKARHTLVYNDEICAAIAKKAVTKSIGENALQSFPAWMASEPFSIYQAFFPGIFAFLGIYNENEGTGADHHNVHFDVDEAVLKLGVAATVQFAIDFLQAPKIPFVPLYRSVDELLPS